MLEDDAKGDTEPINRSSHRSIAAVCGAVALLWFGTQLFMALRPAAIPAVQQRAIHLGFAFAVGFLILAANTKHTSRRVVYCLLAVVGVTVQVYAFREIDFQLLYSALFGFPDFPVAILGILVLTLITGRFIGWTLPVVAAVLIAMTVVGDRLPGILRMAPSTLDTLVPNVYFGAEGVHGIPLDASTRYVFLFIVLGTFLAEFGASDYLIRIASRGIARRRGGAGKLAVMASAIFGTMSDSTTANVTTTGIITIPAMKRSGFHRSAAAGIESAGAVGGQIMPPVMGTVAFVMVALTGIPYAEVIVAAAIPAALYYVALYIGVDRYAARNRIGPLQKPERDLDAAGVKKTSLLVDTVVFVPSMLLLVYLLVWLRWEPSEAAAWALGMLVASHLLRHRSLRSVKQVFRAAIQGTQRAVVVALICAFVGTVIGPVLITGLGLNLAGGFLTFAGGSIFVLLIMAMLASLILGSGLPSTATYIFLAVLLAPPMVEAGLPLLAVHLFIMYFGILSDLSPPTMATVFVASGIAQSKPFPSAGYAMTFGIAGFVVPFLFVARPDMLFLDGFSPGGVVLSVLGAVITLLLFIAGLVGFNKSRLNIPERLLLIACAIVSALPQERLSLGAAAVGVVLLFLVGRGRAHVEPRPEASRPAVPESAI